MPIADLPIISALQLKMLHTIATIYRQPLRLKTFLEGETIVEQDDPASGFYIIRSGSVAVFGWSGPASTT